MQCKKKDSSNLHVYSFQMLVFSGIVLYDREMQSVLLGMHFVSVKEKRDDNIDLNTFMTSRIQWDYLYFASFVINSSETEYMHSVQSTGTAKYSKDSFTGLFFILSCNNLGEEENFFFFYLFTFSVTMDCKLCIVRCWHFRILQKELNLHIVIKNIHL